MWHTLSKALDRSKNTAYISSSLYNWQWIMLLMLISWLIVMSPASYLLGISSSQSVTWLECVSQTARRGLPVVVAFLTCQWPGFNGNISRNIFILQSYATAVDVDSWRWKVSRQFCDAAACIMYRQDRRLYQDLTAW